jgi:anti-anti-sigma regulatory factor
MLLTATRRGQVVVVTVQEPALDRRNHSRFKAEVAAHLCPGVKIALGLGSVRRVDGPGCGALLAFQKETAALGGEVKLFSVRQPVRDLFLKLRLHRRVELYNLEEEVVRSFEGL